ncbi:MAG: helix-turn-helix domain-containing protein [Pirellulales bacterium]
MADSNTPERAAALAKSAWIRDEALGVVLKNIRARREKLALTQQDVATAAGWKQAFVAAVELGKKPTLSYGAVAVFAHVLNTTVLELGTKNRFGEPSPIRERTPRKKRRGSAGEAAKKPARNGAAKAKVSAKSRRKK